MDLATEERGVLIFAPDNLSRWKPQPRKVTPGLNCPALDIRRRREPALLFEEYQKLIFRQLSGTRKLALAILWSSKGKT